MNPRNAVIMMVAAGMLVLLAGCDREDFGGISSSERNPAVQHELFMLARMNGCLECHEVTVGKFGPSWNEISKRYQNAPRDAAREQLIYSVRNGSNDQYVNWKTAEGMPPMKNRVSDEHIEQLVDYILALRD